MHEDEDILGIFSLEEYNVMSGKMGMVMWGMFLGILGTLSFAVISTYPDRPSAPKEYLGGLEEELGGPGALRVSQPASTELTSDHLQAHKAGDEVLGVKL